MSTQVAHRPGPFKQSNKPHKGGASKSNKNEKGKTDVKKITHAIRRDLKKKERRHKANQIRKNKRDLVLQKKRGIGFTDAPPILVEIIPLSRSVNPIEFLGNIKECDDMATSFTSQGHCHISFHRQKQRFTLFVPQFDDIHAVMDAAKVANTILFIHSADKYDEYIGMLLSVVLAHSCPSTVHVVQGLDKLNPKKKSELKKLITKQMESWFPDEKLLHADTKQELQMVLRHIGNQKQRSVGFRDMRPNLLVEKVEFHPDSDSDSTGTLLVSGYIRQQPLNVNGLVHVPGWGDFQMSKIDYDKDPYPLVERKKKNSAKNSGVFEMEEMSDNLVLSDKPNPAEQQSLMSEVIPDPMEGEQTWPTEEELQEASRNQEICDKKRVVKGTSEYQSAWIVDSDGEEISSCNESEDDDACSMVTAEENPPSSDQEMLFEDSQEEKESDMTETMTEDGDPSSYDKNMNLEEEQKMLVRFREERMEQMFPDEMDTPVDVPAKIRYQKYRGLKSFADSPWDPMQNLPLDYARIYRFENFRQTRKRVLAVEREGALPGMYVTIHVHKVLQSLYDDVKISNTFIIYGLLPHEQKMSVVNVAIRKHPTFKEPIKSKDVLIFHVGFRRFVCQPIFSVHSTGNKFKFERFLPADSTVVASFFAPIMFQPASVVVFQQHSNGHHSLVATGSLLNVDPNRVVVKRIILSGYPFKILKRTAVVRYMFFNRDDINWFKRIELRTKCGRKGHIKEALGSHGHMKCVFDQQLQSQDVVLMSLYKRVFPKWTYCPSVPTPVSPYEANESLFM